MRLIGHGRDRFSSEMQKATISRSAMGELVKMSEQGDELVRDFQAPIQKNFQEPHFFKLRTQPDPALCSGCTVEGVVRQSRRLESQGRAIDLSAASFTPYRFAPAFSFSMNRNLTSRQMNSFAVLFETADCRFLCRDGRKYPGDIEYQLALLRSYGLFTGVSVIPYSKLAFQVSLPSYI